MRQNEQRLHVAPTNKKHSVHPCLSILSMYSKRRLLSPVSKRTWKIDSTPQTLPALRRGRVKVLYQQTSCWVTKMLASPPPVLGKCRSGGGCIIVGHVFVQLPVSVSSRNKQGYAWLALHEVAAKRRPRSGILQLTHSYRRGSENCNLHFPALPLLNTGGWPRSLSSVQHKKLPKRHPFVPSRGASGEASPKASGLFLVLTPSRFQIALCSHSTSRKRGLVQATALRKGVLVL